MRPLRNWLSVERQRVGEDSIIYVPDADTRKSLIGVVTAVGDGATDKHGFTRPLDLKPGERIVYSANIDKYRVGDRVTDLIEEASVIGRL